MKYRWEHNLLECYYWKGIKVNKMLLRKTKYYKSTYKTWRWREKAIEILALYLRARLQRTKEPKPFVSIQLNKFKGEGWMDFYLTINSRLVREKHWYKDINRLPYGNLTGKNESMKRHQKTHNSPERSSYASVVFCGMYPVSLAEEKNKKTKRRLSPLVLLLSSGRHAKFPRGQKLCPTSVRSSTKHAVESPQVSSFLTGGFIHCPSSWHRIACARVWKRNSDGGDRPPSVIRMCRSVSLCPVQVDPLLSHAREMRWGGGGWGGGGGGDLSRVSTGRKLRESPPRSRRGEVSARSGRGCSWIDPNLTALMKPSRNQEISGVFLLARGDTKTREARASESAVRCNSVRLFFLKLNDVWLTLRLI